MAFWNRRKNEAENQQAPQATGYAAINQQNAGQSHYDQAYYPVNPPPGQYGHQPQGGQNAAQTGTGGYASMAGQGYQQMPPLGYTPPQTHNTMDAAAAQSGMGSSAPLGGYAAMNQPPVQESPQEDSSNEDKPDRQPHFAENQPLPDTPPRKQGLNLLNKLLIGTAIVFAVWYIVSLMIPERPDYAVIQAGTLGAHYEGDALIVRKETPWTAEGVTSIEYEASERETVTRSQTICRVFSSGYSTREMATMQEYRDQIRDYQKTLLGNETTTDSRMDRANADVLARCKEVRSIVAGTKSNLYNQEKLLKTAISTRQDYFRQKYATDQRLSRLYDEERNQKQRIDSWTKTFVANEDTIVSVYTDGYESVLTFDSAPNYKPEEVRRMINGALPEDKQLTKSRTTIYRTVSDGEWLVLMLVDEKNWNPVTGQTYELQLERFESLRVNAEVLSTERSGNELLLRLRVKGPVSNILYMRTCRAVIGDYISTFAVPKNAIYRQDGMDGVVLIEGQTKSFIPVTKTYEQDGYVYVSPINAGLLYEGLRVMLFY